MRPNCYPYSISLFELEDDIKIYSDKIVYIRVQKYRNKVTGEIKTVFSHA